MKGLTSWFIRNPVAANLMMMLILIGGFFTVKSIRIEGFPKLPADTVTIQTTFGEGYATQIDEQITQKIEKALEGLDGVKNIRSTSMDGISVIEVQKNESHKLQKLLDDVRICVNGIADLPNAADKPVITRNEFDFPALFIQLYGDTDPKTLQELSRKLKYKLLEQPEISRLQIWGQKAQEIKIEVLPSTLEKYDFSIEDIVGRIRQSSLMFETGTLKTKGGDISVRADNQAYYKQDYAEIPIIEQADGVKILLGDIATIIDGYHESDVLVRFNGKSSVGMQILIGRKENLLMIADVAKEAIADFDKQLPPEINISIWGDSSDYISERLELLQSNAFQGLLLVAFLLALFLNVKLTFWVAMGIPISVAGAIATMGTRWIDYSLNDMTTFGLIIALGILVDDAVVVGESVFTEREKEKDPIIGTEKGVHRVATATIFGVLTTVAAFMPMMMINNSLGKALASFAGIVILALIFSLLESKFLLPAHLAHVSVDNSKKAENKITQGWKHLQQKAQGGLNGLKNKIYTPVLKVSLKQRYAVLIVFIALASLGIGLIAKGKIKTVFFPEIPGQMISVKIEMDTRAPLRLINENTNIIENVANQLNDEYIASGIVSEKPIKHILKIVEHAGSAEIYAELTKSNKRKQLETMTILKEWQDRVGRLEGTTNLTFSGSEDIGGGFQIQLYSKNEQSLKAASDEVITYLNDINGVRNLRDTLKGGKPELQLKLKPEAQHLGFNTATLATQIGHRFAGAEAQKIQRNNKEVKVVVRNAKDARRTFANLMQTRLKSENGQWLPLLSIATIESGYATDYITRRNGKRVNTVRAYIDKSIVAPAEVSQKLFEEFVPKLRTKFPDVEFSEGGELEEMGEIKGGLIRAFIITCILIYTLMAIPLKSYWQPFIIMSVVPFGIVGAAMGHMVMGLPLSLLSFFGMLALTGVVVNDSLVMMTHYNQTREKNIPVHKALIASGVQRFQAIFLTTATTVAGLMPLITETSEQAQYLIPAAVSLAFGEIFATTITLIIIPLLIAISEDVKGFFHQTPTHQHKR